MTDKRPVNDDSKATRYNENRTADGREQRTDRDRPTERQTDEAAVLRRATKGKKELSPD